MHLPLSWRLKVRAAKLFLNSAVKIEFFPCSVSFSQFLLCVTILIKPTWVRPAVNGTSGKAFYSSSFPLSAPISAAASGWGGCKGFNLLYLVQQRRNVWCFLTCSYLACLRTYYADGSQTVIKLDLKKLSWVASHVKNFHFSVMGMINYAFCQHSSMLSWSSTWAYCSGGSVRACWCFLLGTGRGVPRLAEVFGRIYWGACSLAAGSAVTETSL